MKIFFKFLIFFITPHLIFDKIHYLFAKVDDSFADAIRGEGNIFVFLGCDYANLGDYAITLAQKRILEKMYPDRNVVTIGMDQTYSALKTVVKNNNTNDIVTLIGGGNMGDMYYGFERKRNFVISKLSRFKIVSFPQTISFSKSLLGKLALRRTIRTYSLHPNLTLLAREQKSFDLMKRYFSHNKVALTPDVVMTYGADQKEKNRAEFVLSFRNDNEKALSENQKQKIVSIAKKMGQVTFYDTCSKDIDNLNNEFEKLLKKYSESRLVITDRLHGMIFAYITGTPAIVFENSDGKILHSYEWIKSCGYIKLMKQNEIEELGKNVENLDLDKNYICNNGQFNDYFLSQI